MVPRDLLAVAKENAFPSAAHYEEPAVLQSITFKVTFNALLPGL